MFSVIENYKMNKRTVEEYLMSLLDKLIFSREGDDLTGLLPCNLATLRRKSKIYIFMQTLESSGNQR